MSCADWLGRLAVKPVAVGWNKVDVKLYKEEEKEGLLPIDK